MPHEEGVVIDQELLRWFQARDCFLNGVANRQDFVKGLRRARTCDHEEARWLCQLFPEAPTNEVQAKRVFLECERSARSLCFAGRVKMQMGAMSSADEDEELVAEAANMGYPFAMGMMISWTMGDERFKWAEKAARGMDRVALTFVGHRYWWGWECARDEAKAFRCYRVAAEMDDSAAQHTYGRRKFGENDVRRYRWWNRAVANGNQDACHDFVSVMFSIVEGYEERNEHPEFMFELGKAFLGHVDGAARMLFAVHKATPEELQCARRAVHHYLRWCEMAKAAIRVWIVAGIRNGIVRDVRRLIASVVWANRHDWCVYKEKRVV